MDACIQQMPFDTNAFGFPFHRVIRFDEAALRSELDGLSKARPMAVDAKCPADDIGTTHMLMRLGFRKVCMQVTLRCEPQPLIASDVVIDDSLALDEDTIWQHARNFTADRFSLDPLLPAEGKRKLYFNWLHNSLSGSKKVAHIGANLCTFSYREEDAVIDLTSILEPRRGYGRRIIRSIQAAASEHGVKSVIVSTECENKAAWNLYQACGFLPVRYTSAFHLVLTGA